MSISEQLCSARNNLCYRIWEFYKLKKNCTFTNNFSITSTIFMTTLNGYFELYNSSIYNNFATNNPVGEILDSANLWIMSNVVIYSNQALTISVINSELNTRWNYLWFVPSNFINYINANKLLNINTIDPSLIQLILSSLSIQNNSKIYDQDVLFNIFISVLSISNLQLFNLKKTTSKYLLLTWRSKILKSKMLQTVLELTLSLQISTRSWR